MLIEKVNEYICNPNMVEERGRFGYYPSEASAISRITGKCLGKCLRAAYYSWTRVPHSNPVDARGQWTFAMGKAIEELYVRYFKEMGIWVGNNVKFYDREHNISGEVDIFVKHADKIKGVEIKTAYGYGFQKNIKVSPKEDNLMQVALYLANFPQIEEWILLYHSRDTQEHVEYVVSMKDGNILINNSLPVAAFTLGDIYERYNQLGAALMTGTEPKQDFVYMYTVEQSEQRFVTGEISKTKMAAVKSGKETDSDWQCLYCNYLDRCWAMKRAQLKLK